MTPERQIYDISVALGGYSVDYPGDEPFARELTESLRDGGSYDLSRLRLSAHTGTHLDAPSHFVPGGRTIDQYAASDLILPAHVIAVPDRVAVRPADLSGARIRPGDALLFKTENSSSGRCRSGRFSESFVFISPEAADLCVQRRAGLVGIDYVSVDRFGDDSFPVHHRLLENGILVLEGIDLGHVPAGTYTLWCLPLRIAGGEASPVRAVLVG